MKVLIDDRLLRAVLLEREPPALRRIRRGDRVATTGTWLYRLCQAVADSTIQGSLSGPLAQLPPELRLAVTGKLVTLPAEIAVASLRDLVWDMGQLVHRRAVNLIALEALAAARHHGATICVGQGNRSPRLEAAATAERVPYRVIAA
ncbi:MAG TPA: hypothetical protein VMU14_03645 [Acidimicrobiales bacterium]|nr:hypothetical protein [Acidimicrobiales bacterium]